MLSQLIIGRWRTISVPAYPSSSPGLLIPIHAVLAGYSSIMAGQVIPINIFSGALWGVYGLASFNMMLELIPRRSGRVIRRYTVVVMIALSVGARSAD